jgi:carbonic anhydrase
MKKISSRISIVFIVAMCIGNCYNISSITLAEPINNEMIRKVTKISEIYKRKMPDDCLKVLQAGNERFQKDKLIPVNLGITKREELVSGQHPLAVIISCSDSRVPPEFIFNQGLGDLFVIRVAGNVLDEIELGSVEYAVKYLKAPLIVVMGHEHCGAIEAAVKANGEKQQGNIGAIVDKIEPSVKKVKSKNLKGDELVCKVTDENIYNTSNELKSSKIIKEQLLKGNIKIIEAKYMLKSGAVQWFKN